MRIWLVMMLFLVAGCSRPAPVTPRPNVILLTIDALRADHLSCYGYTRNTTPCLDQLAARGVIFHNAYGTSSWTAPSMASLFTGLYPRSHGVQRGVPRAGKIIRQEVLDSSFITLAEILKEKGYSTYGISSNGHLSPETGMAQGFDSFKTFWFEPSPRIHETAMKWKHAVLASKPFFLWVHYFDPHMPYHARAPWVSEYAGNTDLVNQWQGRPIADLKQHKKEIRKNPAIQSALMAMYDSEINYADEFIRKLLEDHRLMDHTLVIITADHGEAFLEHNQLGHGHSLYEEEIKVPLIFLLPEKGTSGISAQTANLTDIYPTILDYLEIPVPPPVQGISLLPYIRDPARSDPRSVVCELERGFQKLSIRNGPWKLIRSPGGTKRKKWRLFNLSDDPLERNNLCGDYPDQAGRLDQALIHWRKIHPRHHPQTVDSGLSADQRKVLKSMGYTR